MRENWKQMSVAIGVWVLLVFVATTAYAQWKWSSSAGLLYSVNNFEAWYNCDLPADAVEGDDI